MGQLIEDILARTSSTLESLELKLSFNGKDPPFKFRPGNNLAFPKLKITTFLGTTSKKMRDYPPSTTNYSMPSPILKF